MYKINYNDINIVEIELTNKCTLKCIQCPRNNYGKDSNIPKLNQNEITLQQFKTGFDINFLKQLEVIYLCGTYGDPIHNTHILEIIKYIRKHNKNVFIDISTHGNTYSGKWWRELARILGKNSQVSFAIDGLADTYSIYRNAGVFEKVISNLSTFIKAGGNSRWSYIVFKHNQHQVNDARRFSEKLGVSDFLVKKTNRFIKNTNDSNEKIDIIKEIYGTDINNNDILIEVPTISEYIHPLLKSFNSNNNIESSKINCISFCKFDNKTHIYVDTHGIVTPCGWLGGHAHYSNTNRGDYSSELNNIIEKSGGLSKCNIFERKLSDIVNDKNGIFSNIIKSWNLPTFKDGKLKQCSVMCGSKINAGSLNHLDRRNQ